MSWFETFSVFDQHGLAELATVSHRVSSAEPLSATSSYHDGAGRVAKTERLKGVWIEILGNDDTDRRSRVNSYGGVLSTDHTTYESLCRATQTQRTTGAEVTLESSGDTELTIVGTRSRVVLSLTTAGRVATIPTCLMIGRSAPFCPMFA